MGYGHMMDSGWGMGFGLHGVWGLLIWGLVIFAVVMLVRHLMQKNADGENRSETTDAKAILAQRFAKGEISEAEYQEKSATLAQ